MIEAGSHAGPAMAAFSQLAGVDFHRMLAGYPGPVLLVNGDGDEPNRKAEAALLERVPQVQSTPIAGASYLANLEQPEAYTAARRDFAGGLPWNLSGRGSLALSPVAGRPASVRSGPTCIDSQTTRLNACPRPAE